MEIKSLVPANGRVLVRIITSEETKKTGLISVSGTMANYMQGEVVFKSKSTLSEQEIGNKILFMKYGVDEVEVAGEKLVLVEEGNIIATFE